MNIRKTLTAVAVLLGASALGAVSANAASINIDDAGIQSGSISYDGAGGALVGSDISFNSIFGDDTPANAGVMLECIDCVLNFRTGGNVSSPGNPISGAGGSWEFGAGGRFVLRGTVQETGGGAVIVDDRVILSGSFTGTPTLVGESNIGLFGGLGTDTKDPRLASYFGYAVGTEFTFAVTGIALFSCADVGADGFDCSLAESDIVNTVVPLPAAAWLFASALLGLRLVKRRKN